MQYFEAMTAAEKLARTQVGPVFFIRLTIQLLLVLAFFILAALRSPVIGTKKAIRRSYLICGGINGFFRFFYAWITTRDIEAGFMVFRTSFYWFVLGFIVILFVSLALANMYGDGAGSQDRGSGAGTHERQQDFTSHRRDFYREHHWYSSFYQNENTGNAQSNAYDSYRNTDSRTDSSARDAENARRAQEEARQEQETRREQETRHEQEYTRRNTDHEKSRDPKLSRKEAARMMFGSCRSFEQLQAKHRMLQKVVHPDNGGDNELYLALEEVYEELKKELL